MHKSSWSLWFASLCAVLGMETGCPGLYPPSVWLRHWGVPAITALRHSQTCCRAGAVCPWTETPWLCSGLGELRAWGDTFAVTPQVVPGRHMLLIQLCILECSQLRQPCHKSWEEPAPTGVSTALKPCSREGCCYPAQMYPTASTQGLMYDCTVQMQILWNTVAGLYCRIMWEDNEGEKEEQGTEFRK